MSNRRSFPSCGPATLSSWTICPPTRSMASDRRSRPPARACDTCPLTVPTSIPSKWPSPSSRPYCAPPRREPSPTSARPLQRQLSRRRRIRCNLTGNCLSYDFSRQEGEKEPLGEGWLPSGQRRGSDRDNADRLTGRARVGSPSSFPSACTDTRGRAPNEKQRRGKDAERYH